MAQLNHIMHRLLFLLFANIALGATPKTPPSPQTKPAAVSAGQIQSAVRSAMPGFIAKAKIATDQSGRPAQFVSLTVTRTEPISGWADTWGVSGKVRVSDGSERGYEARVLASGGSIKVTDITLGF